VPLLQRYVSFSQGLISDLTQNVCQYVDSSTVRDRDDRTSKVDRFGALA
jgi:hypothetical protein